MSTHNIDFYEELMKIIFELSSNTMQSDGLAHLSNVYSVITGACIPIFHCILNNSA